MSRKKLFIGLTISALAIVAVVVVVVAIVAGLWFKRASTSRANSSKAANKPTPVGTPKGSRVTKSIGPEGGTISSADGRITVTVSPKAVAEKMNFSIQPLTNMAPGGLGDAYRLEPSGRTFSIPVELTFKFTDDDVKDSAPEALTVAYQDTGGFWKRMGPPAIDKQKKTYSVSTTHFTDIDFQMWLHAWIEPQIQSVGVGKSTTVKVFGCRSHEDGPVDKLVKFFGGTPSEDCRGLTRNGSTFSIDLNWKTNIGTIETGKRQVTYTAPARVSENQLATVSLPWTTTKAGELGGGGEIYADIWIETAFEARGNDGPMRYSGKICSLTDDFRVTVTHPLISYDIYFFPYYKGNVSDSPDALRGRFSYEAKRGMLVSSGYGVYEVKGWDTDHPVIICNENSEAHGPMIGGSGKGVAVIELAPTSQACGGK
jgi:hypothetical protein